MSPGGNPFRVRETSKDAEILPAAPINRNEHASLRFGVPRGILKEGPYAVDTMGDRKV